MPARTWFHPSTGRVPCQRMASRHVPPDVRAHRSLHTCFETPRDLARLCTAPRRGRTPSRASGVATSRYLRTLWTPTPPAHGWSRRGAGAGAPFLRCTVRPVMSGRNARGGHHATMRRGMVSDEPDGAGSAESGRRMCWSVDQRRRRRQRPTRRTFVLSGHGKAARRTLSVTAACATRASRRSTVIGSGSCESASVCGRTGHGWLH